MMTYYVQYKKNKVCKIDKKKMKEKPVANMFAITSSIIADNAIQRQNSASAAYPRSDAMEE